MRASASSVVAALLVSLAATSGVATARIDVPVPGRSLAIRVRPTSTAFRFRAVAGAIAAPVPDPRSGASLLVFASNAAGQCRAEIVLPAAGWTPIAGDGARRGWRWRAPASGVQGLHAVTIAPQKGGGGRITVRGRGAGFPCTLAAAQRVPVAVALRLADTRYCAAFGGTSVRENAAGRFRAVAAPAPTSCPDDDVTLADLNVLHGLFCPSETANCRLADRIALLRQWVIARGCPDVVTLEEVANAIPGMVAQLEAALADACPTPYQPFISVTIGFDDEMILSQHPVLSSELADLYGPLRNVLHVRLDHPLGPVDVYATHLASGSDGATSPCGTFGACPAECVAAGAATVRDCQAVQTALLVEQTHAGDAPALLAGDLNETAGSFAYAQLTGRGWIDTYLAAGNAECDPGTGAGCTSGRIDDALTDLEDPVSHESERIDFVFLVPPDPTGRCAAVLDGPDDPDGDGVATRLFADQPNPFTPSCGPAPAPPCWPSDHVGMQVDVSCG